MAGDIESAFSTGVPAIYKKSVLLLEDFNVKPTILETGTGTDHNIIVHESSRFHGASGLKLSTRTTTPAEDDYVKGEISFCYPMVRRICVRARIRIATSSKVKDYQVELNKYTGVRHYKAAIKFDNEVHKLYYWSSGGAWVEIPGYGFEMQDEVWTLFDGVMDLNTGTYKQVTLHGIETSFEGIAVENVGASAFRNASISFIVTALIGEVASLDVDELYVGEQVDL